MRRSPWFSRIECVALSVLFPALLVACGGSAAVAPASAPMEVVIAPEVTQPAPSVSAVASSSADALDWSDVPEGDAVASAKPEDRAKLELELSTMNLSVLSALSANGGSVNQGVLSMGQPMPSGGAGGIGGLHLGGGQGGVVGGGLAGIGGVSGPSAATVKGPVGSAAVSVVAGSGDVPDASRMGAGMAPGFRRCFNQGLKADPTMKGTVTISVEVAADGAVGAVIPTGGKGLSHEVLTCVVARARAAQFAAPPKGKATVKYRIDLTAI